jgi:radical SAM protein with 4Fe4S-binding SPASM domain
MEEASTASTIQLFKTITDNPIMRRVLRSLSKYCEKDKANRLEVALELYVGIRKRACFKCRASKKILTPIIKVAAKGFGVPDSKMKKKFTDPSWRRGLVNVIKGIGWFGVRQPYVPGAPFQIVWNITKACNMNCAHCYESAGGKKAPDELSTEDVLKGIDKLADAGCVIIAFSGGEPTIHPDILKFIEHARRRGIYVAVATNALAFASRETVKKYKQAGLEFAQISLDAATAEIHDNFRGVQGAFEKTVQGIKNCVDEGLFVEVAMTATKTNYKEVSATIELADKLGARWFMLYNFVPVGRGVEIIDLDLTPDEREQVLTDCWEKMKTMRIDVLSTAPQFAKVAQDIEEKNMKLHKLSSSRDIIPTHFYNPKLSGQLKRLAEFIGGCGAGRFYMSIEPNGDLYPCVFFPHEEQVKVGNLLTDNFEQIWRHNKFLWECRDKDKLAENCHSCKYKYTCGGCRARAYNYFHNVYAPDPGCTVNNEYWLKLKGSAPAVN